MSFECLGIVFLCVIVFKVGLFQREMNSLRILFVLRGGGQSSRGFIIFEDFVFWFSFGSVILFVFMEVSKFIGRLFILDLFEIYIYVIYMSVRILIFLRVIQCNIVYILV